MADQISDSELQNPATEPSPVKTSAVARWPKSAWIALGTVSLLLVIALTVMTTLLLTVGGSGSQDSPEVAVKSPEVVTQVPTPTLPPVSEVPVETGPTLIPLGLPIASPNYSLVIDSVEILDQIDTVSGVPIVAPAGTKLVLVRSTISITGNAQDLTCGSSIFMQARDSEGAEMAHVFEGPEIPGNPPCNYKTSAGETTTWNFAFKMGADRSPGILEVTDTNVDGQYNWGEMLVAALS